MVEWEKREGEKEQREMRHRQDMRKREAAQARETD
jgi:hypothetical protein